MSYIKLIFDIDDRYHEHFIAELMDLDFYGFEQLDNRLIAYVEQRRYNDSSREMIEQMIGLFPGATFAETEKIEEQNWNRAWEETIQPQVIGKFLVRPTWSNREPDAGQLLLEIDPKMAFGTGYHATTRLMLRQLGQIDFKGKEVLDAGTGTGILAIASIKLGARRATGFDIDPWSEKNAAENAMINRVTDQIKIYRGSEEVIGPDEMFDITLANINRNVILELIPFFTKHTRPGGVICLTGLLYSDEEIIREKLKNQPVNVIDLKREEEWILFHLEVKQSG
jgi:ribosomal protein L11 methyltransferase